MTRVLDETTSENLNKEDIISRVDDWARRIDELYRQITKWLPLGWTAKPHPTIRMHEELMQKFGVPARDLPVLELSHQTIGQARIEPRGLWIIGANGRLDLISKTKHYVIVDMAENFEEPKWRIAPFMNRDKLQSLSRQTLGEVLNS